MESGVLSHELREDLAVKYPCPVCGYRELEEPPERFSICPSCGTEFGYDDFVFDPRDRVRKLSELRNQWLAAGAPWFDRGMQPPPNWRPYAQIIEAGLAIRTVSASSSVTSTVVYLTDPGSTLFSHA